MACHAGLGLTLDGATELAYDRDAWRGVVWRTRGLQELIILLYSLM